MIPQLSNVELFYKIIFRSINDANSRKTGKMSKDSKSIFEQILSETITSVEDLIGAKLHQNVRDRLRSDLMLSIKTTFEVEVKLCAIVKGTYAVKTLMKFAESARFRFFMHLNVLAYRKKPLYKYDSVFRDCFDDQGNIELGCSIPTKHVSWQEDRENGTNVV